ncbi:DUF1697 domain-containing protein [Enterococcus asini]|uniref:DUF1697 domain-containing protein n=1 Tax=Enterococcus asini TaxID=57732 RepID=UPI0032E3A543
MILRIGFFRGLNVGGKNKLAMAELKSIFQDMNFQTLKTVGNTGVILFDAEESKHTDAEIATIVSDNAGVPTSFLSISYADLDCLLKNAPSWWNENKDWRHNAIFLLENRSGKQLLADIPPTDENIEKNQLVNNTILWSSAFAERKLYYKSQYRKLLKHESYPFMTIRNANTLNKTYQEATKMLTDDKNS